MDYTFLLKLIIQVTLITVVQTVRLCLYIQSPERSVPHFAGFDNITDSEIRCSHTNIYLQSFLYFGCQCNTTGNVIKPKFIACIKYENYGHLQGSCN
jgi:hypothetical protein